MLKVGGIYNDKKMNGYFIVLEENKQFVLFYTILCFNQNGVSRLKIINKLQNDLKDLRSFEQNLWFDEKPSIMTGEDGYLGQIPEEIWKAYLIALHETDMYEWCLNREIYIKR